jgi:predicted permease
MIDPLLIPIFAVLLPIVLVPIILGIRYKRYERELEHTERIKALELGRSLRSDDSWWTLPRISVAIGVGVPAVVFCCAWQASESLQDPKPAWICAAVVGTAAVISGSFLAARYFLGRDDPMQVGYGVNGKSRVDADAFDLVSSRG